MTIEKAIELISMHVDMGSGYNRHAARMVLGEVMRDHGQQAVDKLIRDHNLEEMWDIKPGTHFESAFKQ